MYQEAIPWVPEVFFSSAARLRAVFSFFFVRRAKRPRHANDHTRETEGTRWERHDKGLVSRVLQLGPAPIVHLREMSVLYRELK